MKDMKKSDFEALARLQLTVTEMCEFFNCHMDTLNQRCMEWFDVTPAVAAKKFRQDGLVSLRRKIWDKGVNKGDNVMLKMLAENYLGMSSKTEISGNAEKPVVTRIIDDIPRAPTPAAQKQSTKPKKK